VPATVDQYSPRRCRRLGWNDLRELYLPPWRRRAAELIGHEQAQMAAPDRGPPQTSNACEVRPLGR
jgi:hypothetical protein